MVKKELYKKETNWGEHIVTAGFGKYTGKFIAQSFGWGGARGYFKAFDSLEEAKAYVLQRTRPMPASDAISL